MDKENLSWRVEEACANAWPSAQVILASGWLIRISGGTTRRTNSVNPTRLGVFDPAPILDEAESLYMRAGQPMIFRAPSIAEGLDDKLSLAKFQEPEAETITLFASSLPPRPPSSAVLNPIPTNAWLNARAEMNKADTAASAAFEQTLGLIAGPVRFASVNVDGQIGAIAYGALSRGLLVIESVATRIEMRRQGLGREVVAALMMWAREEGVSEACLQVMTENTAARRLYDRLGFADELYRYHYRRR